MHRVLLLLSLLTLHPSLFAAPPQLLRATLTGDNQLAPSATLTAQSGSATTFASGSSLTLASGSTLTAPANILAWSAVNKTGSSLADLASRPWSALTDTPTTLDGYGIADAYTSPLTTAGDLLYGGTSGAPTRLGIGTSGQVLSVSSGGLPAWTSLSGTGTVTSITAGTGLTGGTITGSGTIGLDTSGVTAGSYGSASAVPVLTVDATGRVTAASTASISAGGGMTNPMTTAGDLIYGGASGAPTRLGIGTAGQVLKVNSGATGYEFGSASGTGDVTGPSSSTSGRLAVFSGTTGKVLADSSTLTVSGGTLYAPGSIVIGEINQISQLAVASNASTSTRGFVLSQHTSDAAAALFIAQKSRGSSSAPSNISAGDYIMAFNARGFRGEWVFLGNFGYRVSSVSSGVAGGWYFAASATNDEDPYSNGTVGLEVLSAKVISCPWTTASSSPTTGALVVSGGVGISGRTSTGALSVSTSGTACDGIWSASASLDFGSISAASQADLTITVTGASVGDSVQLGLPAAPTAGIVFNAWVSAANTVTIRATNISSAAIDPASATYRATVMSF